MTSSVLSFTYFKVFMIITLVLVITSVNHNQSAHGVSIALFVDAVDDCNALPYGIRNISNFFSFKMSY